MSLKGLLLILTWTYCLAASLEYLERLGRTQVTEAGTLQSDWPHSGFRFQFIATQNFSTININFADCASNCHSYVALHINCEHVGKFEVNSAHLLLQYSFTTSPGQVYDVSLRKVTETLCGDAFGVLETTKFAVEGGNLVPRKSFSSICDSKYKLLIFGDSFTAGYGVDQLSPCSFTSATEDVTHAHAVLLAQALQGEIQVIAWSGKGAVRNYGDVNPVSVDPLPAYYNRTLGGQAAPVDRQATNYWNPLQYQPDIVLVMLGTNDYSTQPAPSDDQFVTGMTNFVTQIHSDYPMAQILLLCAPGSPAVQCKNIQTAASQSKVNYFEIPANVWDGGVGCDGHPYAITQQNMANAVLPVVQKLLPF